MLNPAEFKIQLPPPPAALELAESIEIRTCSDRKLMNPDVGVVPPFVLSREALQREISGDLIA